eukprot:497160-Prymnesium_polylepis.1
MYSSRQPAAQFETNAASSPVCGGHASSPPASTPALRLWLDGVWLRGSPRSSTSAIVMLVLRLTSLHMNGLQIVAVRLLYPTSKSYLLRLNAALCAFASSFSLMMTPLSWLGFTLKSSVPAFRASLRTSMSACASPKRARSVVNTHAPPRRAGHAYARCLSFLYTALLSHTTIEGPRRNFVAGGLDASLAELGDGGGGGAALCVAAGVGAARSAASRRLLDVALTSSVPVSGGAATVPVADAAATLWRSG